MCHVLRSFCWFSRNEHSRICRMIWMRDSWGVSSPQTKWSPAEVALKRWRCIWNFIGIHWYMKIKEAFTADADFFNNFSLFGVTSQSCGYGLDVKRLESALIPALHMAPLRLTHYTVYYLSILAPDGGSGQVPLKRPTSLPSHHQSENLNSGILDCSAEQHTPI